MYYRIEIAQRLSLIILILFYCQQFGNHISKGNVDDISDDLEEIRVKFHMPGSSALSLKNGELVGQGTAGYRRQENSSPLLMSDPVNIGSCTKWMTATLAGRLIDRKLLSWTTQIYECFLNYNTLNSAFRNATLEQLLAHRAGVQQMQTFYNHHLLDFLAQQGNISQIRRWVAETVLKDMPEVEPGEYLYSNQGYTVAATMMEYITGHDWESLIHEHIFIPLEMTTATIGSVYDDNLPPKAPVGHELLPNQTVPIPRPMLTQHILHIEQASTGPGGFVACTLRDWAKFLSAHITAETTGYLNRDTAAKLKRPFIGSDGYGLGVIVLNRTWALPGQALVHDGDAFGQNTVFWMAPAKNIIAVAYTNCRSQHGVTGQALDAAIGVLMAKYLESAKTSKFMNYKFINLSR